MQDEFGDHVPFEELDSCCQKEVIHRRRYNEVTAKLRTGDRSYERLDVVRNVWKGMQCGCCRVSQDYPILNRLRMQRESMQQDPSEAKENEDAESESDSDFDDDFISTFEQERKDEMEKFRFNTENSKAMGFASHLEDSLEHVASDIVGGMTVVLHLCNSNEELCGEMDLLLERLSAKYLGTRFRRVLYDDISTNLSAKMSTLGILGFNKHIEFVSAQGTLLCFRGASLVTSTSSLSIFTNSDGELYEAEVVKYLDGAGVLETEVSSQTWCIFTAGAGAAGARAGLFSRRNEDNEDDGITAATDREMYCDDPECTKRYAHEHVGGAKNKAATFMMSDSTQGTEALAKNAFMKL
jgi:hypothetical protein